MARKRQAVAQVEEVDDQEQEQEQASAENEQPPQIAAKQLIYTAELRSLTPYSQSRAAMTPRKQGEDHRAYEERVWREHMHVNDAGYVIVPAMSCKNMMSEIAKYLSETVPGKGKATYTKHFEAGVQVYEPVVLDVLAKDVKPEWLFLPSDGVRGSGKRVWKCYPLIPKWTGTVAFIIDDLTVKPVFERYLQAAGRFIGFGRFRPRNNGFYGRFEVLKGEWND